MEWQIRKHISRLVVEIKISKKKEFHFVLMDIMSREVGIFKIFRRMHLSAFGTWCLEIGVVDHCFDTI